MNEDVVTTVLRDARDLISDPARWCKHTMARDRFDQPVDFKSKEAFKWCARGALARVEPKYEVRYAALHRLESVLGRREITVVNDKEGHAAVMAVFDKAIGS